MVVPLIPLAAIALGSGAAAGIGAGLMSGGGESNVNNSTSTSDNHSVTSTITTTYAPVQTSSPVLALNYGSGQSVASEPYTSSSPYVNTSQQPTSNPSMGNTGSGSGGSGLLSGVSDKTFLILGGLAVLGLLGYGIVSSGGKRK